MSNAIKTLHIWLFLHDDVSNIDLDDFKKDYCEHVRQELIRFTDFKVRFIIKAFEIPGLTDIEYPADNTVLLNKLKERWEEIGWSNPGVNIYLLITRHRLNDKALGVAWGKGQFGLASIESYNTLGHEIGHLLGATHEDAAIHYDGWWKQTYTYPGGEIGGLFRGNAYRYSDANRANIVEFLESQTHS